MGAGGKKPNLPEIEETRAAGRDQAFEDIIERIKSAGGEVIEDESSPLFIEVGNQEFEIGTQRIVIFNLNKMDFQLIRKVEFASLQGAGHHKHIEDLSTPRIHISMKSKSELSQDWQVVDLEDMF